MSDPSELLDPGDIIRHRKRGSTYKILHRATMQVDGPLDDKPVLVYQCLTDGRVWVRPAAEFAPSRFELVSASPISTGE